MCADINTAFCLIWYQTTDVVNRAWLSSHCTCCQLLEDSAAAGTLLTVVVCCVYITCDMMAEWNNREPSFLS